MAKPTPGVAQEQLLQPYHLLDEEAGGSDAGKEKARRRDC
jgi:hypothetical protein